ncbi:ATP-binding protein [Paucilactobacillus kaifaensis]|uniref:ATP-binding protein n=1 Tax=Paucilactobacillus kaifaensis TaxID=2559921 RepID=UPI0010F9822C|nr:AAA family ATPase [Paucilactobacillus kaifaensis]
MKIRQIQIDGFGKWQGQSFEINPKLQVIYGQNEAGKTTLSRFITSVLFGFANGHQQYQQYLPKNGAAYGGQLMIDSDNQTYHLKRTKGKNGGTLEITDDEGTVLPSSQLESILGPIDQDLYSAIFSFSQLDLNAIFSLNREDLLTHLQRVGAVGSSQWLALIKEHDKIADEIYKPKGRKPELNIRLKEYEQLDAQVQQAAGQYDHYQDLLTRMAKLGQELQDERRQLDQDQNRLEHLQELSQLMPVFTRLNEADLKTTVVITNDDVTQVQQLQADLAEITAQQVQVQQQLNTVAQDGQLNRKQQFYFDHINKFDEIKQSLPRLSLQIEQQANQNQQIDTWTHAQQQILTHYNVDRLPQAVTSQQITVLEQLFTKQQALKSELESEKQQRLLTPNTNNKTPWWSWGIALVAVILIMMASNLFLKLLAGVILLGGLAAPFWLRQSKKTNNDQNKMILDELQDKLATVEQQLKRFGIENQLSQFDQNQWLAMQGDLRRFNDLEQQINQLNATQVQIANQIADFRKKLAFAHDWIPNEEQASSLVKHVEQFIEEQQIAKDSWQSQQQQTEILTHQLQQINQRQMVKENQKMTIYKQLNINNDADFKTTYHQFLQATAEHEKVTALTSQISVEQRNELAKFTDADDLANQLNDVRQTVAVTKQLIDDKFRQQTSTQLEIEQLAKSGTLTSLRQKQANLQTTINQLVFEWLSEKMTSAWINKALQLASADRFPQIIAQANNFFATLTQQHYVKINIGEEVISVVDNTGQLFEVGELSQGTAEQLYVALRFGFAAVMSDTVNLPLLIDDGFVSFDNLRKEAVFEILTSISQHNQVIYFTADDRILNDTAIDTVINLDKG